MIKLAPPVVALPGQSLAAACIEQLKRYISSSVGAKRAALVGLFDCVSAAYHAYLSAAPAFAGLSPALPRSSTDGERLYSCYEAGRGIDREILDSVRQAGAGVCPYCGLRLRVKPKDRSPDRDHYLPRSVFPEFSILSVNLIVSCDDCNDAKSSKYKTASGLDLFLHPYFDTILARRLLKADASVAGDVFFIKFELDAGMLSADEFRRVKRHVDELDLLRRLSDEAESNLRLPLVALAESASIQDFEAGLKRLAQKTIASSRPNDPIALGLEALARFPDTGSLLGVVQRFSAPPK